MKTQSVSSQDFRNVYEKFYNRIRNYLWPIETLKVLANIECEIYSAFIDYTALRKYVDRLKSAINNTMKDDKFLSKEFNALNDLLVTVETSESSPYLQIQQVAETDPELNKVLIQDTDEQEKEEDIEDENNQEAARYSE